MKILLLFGEPGTGKSSIINKLIDDPSMSVFAFSVRKYADYIIEKGVNPSLANSIKKERMTKGSLSGDNINRLYDLFVSEYNNSAWLVFENYPLSNKQLSHFLSSIDSSRDKIQIVHLTGDHELLAQRIKNRVVCHICDMHNMVEVSYNGIQYCPRCGTLLERRDQYSNDTIERVQRYEEKILTILRDINIPFICIDVRTLSVDELYKQIRCIMEEHDD